MNKIYFISDLHFGHNKVSDLRNFLNIEEMHKYLKNKWNKTVSEDNLNTVFILGDFAFSYMKTKNWESILNGKHIFIQGNHDTNSLSNIQSMIIKFKGKNFELIHNPCEYSGKVKYVLHGHIHKSVNRSMPNGAERINNHIYKLGDILFYNVNCEFHKYSPVLLNEILGELENI